VFDSRFELSRAGRLFFKNRTKVLLGGRTAASSPSFLL